MVPAGNHNMDDDVILKPYGMIFFYNIEFQMPLRSRRRRRSSTIRKSSKRRTISGRRLSSRRRYRMIHEQVEMTPNYLLQIKKTYVGDETANIDELTRMFQVRLPATIKPIQKDTLKRYCLLEMILAGKDQYPYHIHLHVLQPERPPNSRWPQIPYRDDQL